MGAYHGLMPTTHPLAIKNEVYAAWLEENQDTLREDWEALKRRGIKWSKGYTFYVFCEEEYRDCDDHNFPAPL